MTLRNLGYMGKGGIATALEADDVRVLYGDERGEAGTFAPIERPRLVERLAASATYPVTLLIAPAGYGKSVVLRQYLRDLPESCLRFALRGEHTTLLSFLRGLAEALRKIAPHAITALAGAYERTTASPKRAVDLARWMHAHLESFEGVISIDDLHLADEDTDVATFLASLIERTKGRVRWILASRSTTSLPLGTWLAYRDADLSIAEEELRFTFDEVRSAAQSLKLAIKDEELGELLALTEGWPAAMSFALRTSTRSSELRNISAITREMIYRFLAEQVYTALDDDERSLLEVGIALPIIDVAVLERAGFDGALPIVERLRDRTAFIYEESPGIYQCHDLFREFLRHQSALGGKRAQRAIHERAARALESSGDIEHAIGSYVLAMLPADAIRLLEHGGFALLERARGDVVARAIETLDEPTRRENATILALQGTLQAIAGKFARAESLLRRSLARAGNNRDLFAIASLRLAAIIANQQGEVTELLTAVGEDPLQSIARRIEALSLIAGRQAATGDTSAANEALARIEPLLVEVDSDVVRAKVLHFIGIAYHHLGFADKALTVLKHSTDLAAELHLYSVESRANAVLSNMALHEQDDVEGQLAYAEAGATAATKAGDAFALQTGLLQILSAHMRSGDVEKSISTEQRLSGTRRDDWANRYLTLFRGVRLSWEGRFGEAHQLLGSCWDQMTFDFDRALSGSEYALFLAMDGQVEASARVIKEVSMISPSNLSGKFRIRSMAIANALVGLAEAINGRKTQAGRILRYINANGDDVIDVTVETVEQILSRLSSGYIGEHRVRGGVEKLIALGYADLARILGAVDRAVTAGAALRSQQCELTPSEVSILRYLAEGLIPKEIAARTERSVYTIRVHIANIISKFGCHGRAEAIRKAQRQGLI